MQSKQNTDLQGEKNVFIVIFESEFENHNKNGMSDTKCINYMEPITNRIFMSQFISV